MAENLVTTNERLQLMLLNEIKAPNWSTSTANHPYALIPLDHNSGEYFTVNTLFKSCCRSYNITKLERVENPFLFAHYLLKKETLQKAGVSFTERHLFHGTKTANVEKICKYNLNWRLRGQSRGHKFGQGVSFSPDAFYASHYGDVMFMVCVLIGPSTVGNLTTLLPPAPYDTTTNPKGTVVVKYEDDDFYPQYLIHFGL